MGGAALGAGDPGPWSTIRGMIRRRDFLRAGVAAAAVLSGISSRQAAAAGGASAHPRHAAGPYGPLQEPNADGLQLPLGFHARIVARANEPVAATGHRWHTAPDGGATFGTRDGGWIYVSNSESVIGAGAGAIRFAPSGRIVDAYTILSGTLVNCAGGATPWGTWLSCEEIPGGLTYECDPEGSRPAVKLPSLGTFKHEAAAVDPGTGIVYLTEDERDGGFYRFVPNAWGRLDSGVLQIAFVDAEGQVSWQDVPDPNPAPRTTRTRYQLPGSAPFAGGEGIVYDAGHVYFATKRDDRVWDYRPASGRLSLLYDRAGDPDLPLAGVDNVAASGSGDVIVAEDGDNMELVMITPDLQVVPIMRILDQDHSEVTGPAFDPKGQRLYFSSQRGGPDRQGITYEVRGPFRQSAHRAVLAKVRSRK